MLYYCAIRLFSSECYKEHWPAAHVLLVQFVEQYGTIYGEHCITSNVHNLLHVYEDVNKFGPLVNFSSYRYAAKLCDVGRSLRNGHTVLVQAANRISEQIPTRSSSSEHSPFPYIDSTRNGAVVHINSIITLYPNEQSNWFLTHDFYIVKYCSAKMEGSDIIISGKAFSCISETISYYSSKWMKDIYEAKLSDAIVIMHTVLPNSR